MLAYTLSLAKATCPATLLQSTGSPLDGTQKLSDREAAYVANRRENVLSPLWSSYLSDSKTGTTGYNTSSLKPRISIALSGGGYRAALYGAGSFAAFDARNASSVAPLLQLSDFASGISGGSWLITSLVMNDLPDLFSLVLGGDGQVDERLNADVNEKILAGYPTSIIDLWGCALSYHFFNGTTKANFYNPKLPHDNTLLFSNIQNTLSFNAGTMPYPIAVAGSRVSIADQTDAKSPYSYVPYTNTLFEFTPYTFGSFDPTLAAFIPIEYAGTRLDNGQLPSGVQNCTVGYENAGFVIGTSAAIANMATDKSELNTAASDVENLASAYKKLKAPIEAAVPLVANYPNSFQNYVPTTSVAFESAGNQILELVDGGDIESIPFSS
ncbi:hypothetical protein RQP46_006586 [Phenoliferia psychrophenolica]